MKILGHGTTLPQEKFTVKDMAKQFDKDEMALFETHGIKKTYRATDEKVSDLACSSLDIALKNANLEFKELGLLIFASVSKEFIIPNTSAFIQKKMGQSHTGIPCMDIDMSCLGFLSSLEISSALLSSGAYSNIAIVCSEIPSRSLNHLHEESYCLFGDASTSFIVGHSQDKEGLIASSFKTFSDSYHNTIIEGGASYYHPRTYKDDEIHTFKMSSRKALISTIKIYDRFLEDFFDQNKLSSNDFDAIVPHQASKAALKYFKKKYEIEHKTVDILEDYGNCVSVSIPMALSMYLDSKGEKGQKLLLTGTAAGTSLGAVALQI
ncbi:MAG: hypothetical protein MRY83_10060 [Flavobacteriales bacterium]|nr:hypothetical protein [Flavobacteriales bacterium]